jgi:hypothetical protein
MITMQSRVHVPDLRGSEVLDFLLNCTDERYRAWWPGTHLAFHTVVGYPGYIGNVVYMDEFIGDERVKVTGVVSAFEPNRKIVLRFKKGIALPVWLTLEVADDPKGVAITHTIQAGIGGAGSLLDPIFRLHFSHEFARAMDEHVKTEFRMLRDLLHREGLLDRRHQQAQLI